MMENTVVQICEFNSVVWRNALKKLKENIMSERARDYLDIEARGCQIIFTNRHKRRNIIYYFDKNREDMVLFIPRNCYIIVDSSIWRKRQRIIWEEQYKKRKLKMIEPEDD